VAILLSIVSRLLFFINIFQVDLQNVAPAHAPDIVIFIDAITIIFEEATKTGPPSSLPFSCIEAGNDHSLPNLALRLLFLMLFVLFLI